MGEDYDLLLGRRTYEIFAAFWPHMDDEIGRKFNGVNKYVAAGPRHAAGLGRQPRLEGDAAEAVRALKATEGRDLLIQGSSEVIHALLAADLIDQLTFPSFPVVLGRRQAAVRRGLAAARLDAGEQRHLDDGRGRRRPTGCGARCPPAPSRRWSRARPNWHGGRAGPGKADLAAKGGRGRRP